MRTNERMTGKVAMAGQTRFTVVRQRMALEAAPRVVSPPPRGLTWGDLWRWGAPHRDVSPYSEIRSEVNAFRRANMAGLFLKARRVMLAQALGVPTFFGALSLTALRRDGRVIPFGLVGVRVVTTVGVGFLVDAWQNIVELEIQKYHGLGTGVTAEAVGDAALVTELTTEYTGDVRATGTTTEGASANIFRTVATNTLDGTPGAALREHGIFSAASAGVLWDRTLYAAITLSSGDGLQSTYDLTASAGG